MSTQVEKVKEFYLAFGQELPDPSSKPSLANSLLEERIHLKMSLIAEEFFELVEAVYGKRSADLIAFYWKQTQEYDDKNRDVVGAADALADLEYVISGLAIEANIPLDKVFSEVHSSNMSKLGRDGKPILSDGINSTKPVGKIIKGPDFREPDIKSVLEGTDPL